MKIVEASQAWAACGGATCLGGLWDITGFCGLWARHRLINII